MGLGAFLGILVTYFGFVLFFVVAARFAPSIIGPSDALLPSAGELVLLVVIGLLVLSGAAVLAARLAHRILAPLNSVAQAARKIAEGDLTARAQPGDRSFGETALLVDDFNGMAARLERAAADIVTWNAQIAHELRTPLTILRGRLQGLVDGVFTPDEALFRRLLGQVDGLSRLVEDLRVVSLVESGRFDLQPTEVDLAAEIEDLGELVRPELERAGFTLTTSVEEGRAWLDMTRIRQAVLALVENAERYADPCELRLEVIMAGADLELRVVDRGPGLPREFVDRAFALFSRGEGALEKQPAGSGLGLSVVQAIARAHGGEAYYAMGNGRSAFALKLPRRRREQPPAAASSQPRSSKAAARVRR